MQDSFFPFISYGNSNNWIKTKSEEQGTTKSESEDSDDVEYFRYQQMAADAANYGSYCEKQMLERFKSRKQKKGKKSRLAPTPIPESITNEPKFTIRGTNIVPESISKLRKTKIEQYQHNPKKIANLVTSPSIVPIKRTSHSSYHRRTTEDNFKAKPRDSIISISPHLRSRLDETRNTHKKKSNSPTWAQHAIIYDSNIGMSMSPVNLYSKAIFTVI